jgi:hypothetical protein
MRIRRWIRGRRKTVVWEEPALPKFVKINPLSPPGAAQGLQPGDMTMAASAEEFLAAEELEAEEDETALPR